MESHLKIANSAPEDFGSGCTGSREGKQQLIDEASHLECSNSIQLPNLSIIYTHCFRPPHCQSELAGGDLGGSYSTQRRHETTHQFRYAKSETDECCREIAALRSMSCHNPQGTGVNELDGVGRLWCIKTENSHSGSLTLLTALLGQSVGGKRCWSKGCGRVVYHVERYIWNFRP